MMILEAGVLLTLFLQSAIWSHRGSDGLLEAAPATPPGRKAENAWHEGVAGLRMTIEQAPPLRANGVR
jgi:hypothetical protein